VFNIKQVKVICHKATSPSHTDGSVVFTRWRGGHIGATWRIWYNLCVLLPTRVHNSKGKLIGSAVFAQLMAESPYSLQWAPLFSIIDLPMGELDPSKTWFLGPIQAHNPNGVAGLTSV